MRSTMAAALVMATISCGGCGRSGSSEAQAEYVDQVPAPEEPMVLEGEIGHYGGRFVQAGYGSPATFNGVVSNTIPSNEIIGRMFTFFVGYDGVTQEVVPALAKTWNVSADGLSWTFHLRRGAFFSDGRPITADDVLFTFAAHYDPKSASSYASILSSDGHQWDFFAADPLTVTVRTPIPVGSVPILLSGIPIVPKHVLEPRLRDGTFSSAYGVTTSPDALVTSGAWKLKSFTPNDRTVLTRNPYWFRVDAQGQRLPYLDELTFVVVPDTNAADLKFRSGELDALPNPAPANYQWYEDHQRDGRFILHDAGPTLTLLMMFFNLNSTPTGAPAAGAVQYGWFNNLAFRRAVSMAIDRQAIIQSVYFGNAVQNWSSATPGNKHWGRQDFPHADYDPAEARCLLAGLGWADHDGNGVLEDASGHEVSFSLILRADALDHVAIANFIRNDLADIGIRVFVQPMEYNARVQSKDYGAQITNLGLGAPEPALHARLWRASSSLHVWRASQPAPATPEEARVDALMDIVSSSTDMEKRQQAFNEIQRIANEQCWLIWLPVPVVKMPVRAGFGNIHPVPGAVGRFNEQQVFVKNAR